MRPSKDLIIACVLYGGCEEYHSIYQWAPIATVFENLRERKHERALGAYLLCQSTRAKQDAYPAEKHGQYCDSPGVRVPYLAGRLNSRFFLNAPFTITSTHVLKSSHYNAVPMGCAYANGRAIYLPASEVYLELIARFTV